MSDGTNQKSAMAEIVKALKEPGATNAEVVIPAAKEVVLPAAKQIGKGLEDLFFIFFSPLSNKRMKIEAKQKDFIEEVERRVSQIDPEKLTEPSLSVTGRAIDEAKFHVEDDEIRSMFAKLIAASLNSDYNNSTLPAFIEILKQLSPFDVKNLIELYSISKDYSGAKRVGGTIKAVVDLTTRSGTTILEHFIPFKDLNEDNFSYYGASLENLIRLGILNFKHGYVFDDKTFHNQIKDHPFYLDTLKLINTENTIEDSHSVKEIKIEDATWNFTNFGNLFIKCCLEEAH